MINNFKIFAVVLFFLFVTSVRSAHASGTVTPSSTITGCYISNASAGGSFSAIDDCLNAAYANLYGAGVYLVCQTVITDSTSGTSHLSGAPNFVCGSYAQPYSNTLGTASCPVNSTGTTTCTCTDPYIANASGTSCVMPTCPATGTVQSAGYYDLGTVDVGGSAPPVVACSGGCSQQYQGGSEAWLPARLPAIH